MQRNGRAKGRGKEMDATEKMHTVTVGMSWVKNLKTKGIRKYMDRNEIDRIKSCFLALSS